MVAYSAAIRWAPVSKATIAASGTVISGPGCMPAFRNLMAASARWRRWFTKCRSAFASARRFFGIADRRMSSAKFGSPAAITDGCGGLWAQRLRLEQSSWMSMVEEFRCIDCPTLRRTAPARLKFRTTAVHSRASGCNYEVLNSQSWRPRATPYLEMTGDY